MSQAPVRQDQPELSGTRLDSLAFYTKLVLTDFTLSKIGSRNEVITLQYGHERYVGF